MDGERVWALMDAQGRRITWLGEQASRFTSEPLTAKRLYHLKYAAFPRGPYLWQPEEMAAVARVLGRSPRWLFGKTQTIRGICTECGRRRRLHAVAQRTAQVQTQQSTASPGS